MISVTILGNNSAIPAHGRHPTAQVIEIRDQQFLMDCGEGTQLQMQLFGIRRRRINYIFISHLHGDHYFGLIGLITSMGLQGRETPLHIFGPAGLKAIIDLHLSMSSAILPYQIIFEEIQAEDARILLDTPYYSVKCFPVEHRIPCHGFLFTAKSSGRKIDPEKCLAAGIPKSFYPNLKRGEDYIDEKGRTTPNHAVTQKGTADKSYAYCADTKYSDSFLEHIRHVDLLYHESTYLKDNEPKAAERFHSTAGQAAHTALKAEAGRLLLGHYSSRYQDLEGFYLEAREVFGNVEVSVEGQKYVV